MSRAQLRSIAKRLDNAERCPLCGHRRDSDDDLSKLSDEELERRIVEATAKINALKGDRDNNSGGIPHDG